MTEEKIENLVGALALALADDILNTAQRHIALSSPAAAITLISHAPGMTIDELSRALGLSHPGTVRLVDRLVRDRLMLRSRSEHDGRAVALTLTPDGEEVCQRVLSSRQNALNHALAGLDRSDRDTLSRLAETMLRSIVKDADHAAVICRLCDPSICSECPVEAELTVRLTSNSNYSSEQ